MGNKIQRIYVGDHYQVYPTWKPTSSTLAYYPLEKDTNDYSGNGRNGTNSNVTFSNGVGVFNGSSSMVAIADAAWNRPTQHMTILAWAKSSGFNHSTSTLEDYFIVSKLQYYASQQKNNYYVLGVYRTDNTAYGGFSSGSDWYFSPGNSSTAVSTNVWNLYTLTSNGTTITLYLNGTQVAQSTNYSVSTQTTSIPLIIGNANANNHNGYWNGNISKVILENKTWSIDEIKDYYNQTKAKYLGIS